MGFLINPGNKDICWNFMKFHEFLINPGNKDICWNLMKFHYYKDVLIILEQSPGYPSILEVHRP